MIRFLSDVSLRAKITISFVLIVLGGTSISTLIGSRIITSAMRNEALKQVRRGLGTAGIVFAARQEDVSKAVVTAAAKERLVAVADSGDLERLPPILSALRQESNLDFLSFVDARRAQVIRGEESGTPAAAVTSLPFSDFLKRAMAGKEIAGTEVFRAEVLMQENPALPARARIRRREGNDPASNAYVEEGLILLSAVSVKAESGPVGVLYGGVLINRNEEVINQIVRILYGGEPSEDQNSGTVSIFLADTRVATNVTNDGSVRVVGTGVSPEVRQTVLARGQHWYGRTAEISGWHINAYQPIRDSARRIIGILNVGIKEEPFLAVRTDMMLTFLVVAAIGVLVVMGLTYLITRSMIHPLEEMVMASNRIAAGDLDQSVNVPSRDEIGHLAKSFNKMLSSIKTMKLELEEWGRTLEEKVRSRTDELVAVQSQMAQSEKLASIGRLAAGVAHEINNPLGGILSFSMLALEDCPDSHPLRQNLEIIVKQTLRCRETVKGLLDFARQTTASLSLVEVNSIADKTLSLLEKQSIFHDIAIVRKFQPDVPQVLIDPGQLQQVIVNIVLNAVDAMEETGLLTIETASTAPAEEVLIRISDTGKGIPDNVLPFIFEPFFTTKKVGQGTGLGLSIVHGVVARAGGKIDVTSSNKGTTFTLRLPVATGKSGNGTDAGSQRDTAVK
jgi:two-component system, NtrC family, sensor kinase